VARRADGSLVIGRDAPGRGAWLCQESATGGVSDRCLEAAAHRNAFDRAFKTAVAAEAWKALIGALPNVRK
jgi:predicted RNA-binding protein YlxR (DUF448 family)